MDTREWIAILLAVVLADAALTDFGKFSKVSDVPGLGTVTAVYEANDENCNYQLYLELNPMDLVNLNCTEHDCPTMFCPIALPEAAVVGTPFDHACVMFNPLGHEPWDGHNGGFGLSNFNVYFNTAQFDELTKRTCDGQPRCDIDDPENEEFFLLPPQECIPFDYISPDYFGSHAIEFAGNHIISNETFEYFQPYDIDTTSSIDFISNTSTALVPQIPTDERPLWVDCQVQAVQKIMGITPELDSGCRVPRWADVATPAYSFYNATLVGAVIIISQPELQSSCRIFKVLSQPELEWAWDSYFTTFGPVAYFVESTHMMVKIGFDLNNIGENIPCAHHHSVHPKSVSTAANYPRSSRSQHSNSIASVGILSLVVVLVFGIVLVTKRLFIVKPQQHNNRYNL